jgi:hypothetical protein
MKQASKSGRRNKPRKPRAAPAKDPRGLELAQTKRKAREHRKEIANLKRSGEVKDKHIARLQMAVEYLTKCAKADEDTKD